MILLSIYLLSLVGILINIVVDSEEREFGVILAACTVGVVPGVNTIFVLAIVVCYLKQMYKERV